MTKYEPKFTVRNVLVVTEENTGYTFHQWNNRIYIHTQAGELVHTIITDATWTMTSEALTNYARSFMAKH